jgi:hypothetical protein
VGVVRWPGTQAGRRRVNALTRAIRAWHWGQLVIAWILLVFATGALCSSWFIASSALELTVRRSVDTAPKPVIATDGMVFDDTTGAPLQTRDPYLLADDLNPDVSFAAFQQWKAVRFALSKGAQAVRDTLANHGTLLAPDVLREHYAREALLLRGLSREAATARARVIAREEYYTKSRAYYDSVRNDHNSRHPINRIGVFTLAALSVFTPFFALAATWVWLGGRTPQPSSK